MLKNSPPQRSEHISDQWKDGGHWYAMGLTYIGIGYNTDEISDEDRAWIESIETWEDVFDAPFKGRSAMVDVRAGGSTHLPSPSRSEEHTSELQSLMRISYAVLCLKKKKYKRHQ